MLPSYTVFIINIPVNKNHFKDPSLLGCDPVTVTVTGLAFLNVLKGQSVFTFRGPRRIVCLDTPQPLIWRHCISLKCQETVTQWHIPGYLNAWEKPVWELEKLNNIILHSAVSFSFLILWPTSCDTQFTHTCMCHFTVSCSLYLTTDMYTALSLAACIWLQTCIQHCLFLMLFLIKYFMH
jgi:hypothetical protein